MQYPIILNNQHDKVSRDFVNLYGDGKTILNYPNCLEYFQSISAFPSVVIKVPPYRIPEHQEQVVNSETGETEIITIPEEIQETEMDEMIRLPENWAVVESRINFVNQRSVDYPI